MAACNPFTKGHRYLIEQAYGEVDFLYVFVVEEDRFEITFKDRMEMVMSGVADLDNITVIPAGKYIISKETFAQYFRKEQVQIVEDMSYDVHIFGGVIAQELGISCRFVGEEPFDKVTAKYNETMKAILPGYGVEVIEIPRLSLDGEGVVSASTVRKAMKAGDMAKMEKMLPDSTLKYLKEHPKGATRNDI